MPPKNVDECITKFPAKALSHPSKSVIKRSFFSLIMFLFLSAMSAYGQSMQEMKHNAQHDFEKADAELNTVYKKVVAQLSPKGVDALKEAQRAWVIFRDKTAEAYGTGEEGGSLEGLMYVRCQEAITESRTKELTKLFLSDHYPY